MDAQQKLIEIVFNLGNSESSREFLESFKPKVAERNEFDILNMAIDNKLSEINYELAKAELEARHV